MIDPKLNEIPAPSRAAGETTLTDTEKADHLKRSRTGLSINETIAGDTLLSSGSRGVDTSGVSGGAGSGAGSSAITAGQTGESPSPNIVPAATGSGTTVRSGVNSTGLADSTATEVSTMSAPRALNTMEVAERAYQIWCSRGCPEGTAEEDWHLAERELKDSASSDLANAAVS